MNKKQLLAMLASYARSVVGAILALYIAGVTDPVRLLSALVAGLLPVAIRYINPNDTAFGRVPSVSEVDSALKSATPDSESAKVIENFLKSSVNTKK